MKINPNLNSNVDKILFMSLIISGIIMFLLLQFYTVPFETKDFHDMLLSERLSILYTNTHYSIFNYFNGLWLMFSGLFMFCLIGLLDLVNKEMEIELAIKIWYYKKKYRD